MSREALVALGGVAHAPFGALTTYRVGGAAAVVLSIGTPDELPRFADALRDEPRVYVLGNGSNTLVADGEFDGVVVRLGEGFSQLTVEPEDDHGTVRLGAGLDLPVAARRLTELGYEGFEWAVGVPGTVGGACVMNAGGHGSDMRASVVAVRAWNLDDGLVREWSAPSLAFGYRHSALTNRDVVLEATLRLRRGDSSEGKAILREIVRWRREHQPGGANAGSVFRNPEGDSAGRLIEAAGLKGFRHGSAMVSEKHANFIQADADGSANDVLAVIRHVQETVLAQSGVRLETEIRFVGFGAER
jgi:UDP-N-acetylmuramate dehydrogenase